MKSKSIVAYGILTTQATLERTIGHKFDGTYTKVIIPNWLRERRGGLWYARPSESSIMEGWLIEGLTKTDLAALDRLEGSPHHYFRTPVKVTTGSGRVVDTEIYCDSKHRELISTKSKSTRKRQQPAVEDQSLEDLLEGQLDAILGADPSDLPAGFSYSDDPDPSDPSDIILRGYAKSKLKPAQPILPLFAYGALTQRETLEERIGHRWRSEYRPAELHGHFIVKGWPRHLVRQSNAVAYGFVLEGLSESDLEKIDRTEGTGLGIYERCVVTLADGTKAFAYITGPAGHQRIRGRKTRAR